MKLFNKPLLAWKEPREIRKTREKMEAISRPLWLKPAGLVIGAGMMMALWWTARLQPGNTAPALPYALMLAVAGGWFFAYGIPLIYSFCSIHIQISDFGIMRACGNRFESWGYKEIERCEIASIDTGHGTLSVLVIHTVKAKQFVMGIEAGLVPQVEQVLLKMNVRVDRMAQPEIRSQPGARTGTPV
jgi:hypothetical protein